MTTTELLMVAQAAVMLVTAGVVCWYTVETRRLRAVAAEQLSAMHRKERRDEWRDAIRDADRLLQQQLQITVLGIGGVTTLEKLLIQVASEVMAAKKWYDSEFANTIFAKYSRDVTVATYSGMTALISDIWHLLNGYANNLTEPGGDLVSFYVSYFQGVTSRLHTIGSLSESFWKTLEPIIARLMHKAAGWASK